MDDELHKGWLIFKFTDDEGREMVTILNKYRRSLGWTWKRFMLISMAHTIEKEGSNPDLVVAIADYLENHR